MVGREKLNPSGASIVYCFLGGIKSSCSELGWETFDSGRVTSLKPYHIIPWYRVKGLSSESIKTLLPPRSPTSTIGRDMCIESNLDIHSVSQVSQQASYFPTHNIMSRVEEAIMDPGPPFLVVSPILFCCIRSLSSPVKTPHQRCKNALSVSIVFVPFSAACRPPFGFALRSGADRMESQSEHHSHSPSGLLGHMGKSR